MGTGGVCVGIDPDFGAKTGDKAPWGCDNEE